MYHILRVFLHSLIFIVLHDYFCYFYHIFWYFAIYFRAIVAIFWLQKIIFSSDKISDLAILRFNHIPGHLWFYFLHILQEFIHNWKQKSTVEVVIDLLNTFHDIGKILDLGRRTQNPVRNFIHDLCEYNIYGIKLLCVKILYVLFI
jgi:hypothetical protein